MHERSSASSGSERPVQSRCLTTPCPFLSRYEHAPLGIASILFPFAAPPLTPYRMASLLQLPLGRLVLLAVLTAPARADVDPNAAPFKMPYGQNGSVGPDGPW